MGGWCCLAARARPATAARRAAKARFKTAAHRLRNQGLVRAINSLRRAALAMARESERSEAAGGNAFARPAVVTRSPADKDLLEAVQAECEALEEREMFEAEAAQIGRAHV